MNVRRLAPVVLAVLLAAGVHAQDGAPGYVAFSLREAARHARARSAAPALESLAGITRIAGMVHDAENDDVVLFGLDAGGPRISLDALTLALRARLLLGQWPTLSLDGCSDPRQLEVSTRGGIDGSALHTQFLAADVFLKEASLARVPVIEGVPSYLALVLEHARQGLERTGERVLSSSWSSEEEIDAALASALGSSVEGFWQSQTKFWFAALRPYRHVARNGVFVIQELRLGCSVEHTSSDPDGDTSPPALAFAQACTDEIDTAMLAHVAVRGLKSVYDLVAVAEGIRGLSERPDLSYFLSEREVPRPGARASWPARTLCGVLETEGGGRHVAQVTGGVELRTAFEWLQDGDLGELRTIVLDSRPAPESLSWRLPLGDWKLPNSVHLAPDVMLPPEPGARPGYTVYTQSVALGPSAPPGSVGGTIGGFTGFASPRPLGGVSMRVQVHASSLRAATDDSLRLLRDRALGLRPSPTALWWTLEGGR